MAQARLINFKLNNMKNTIIQLTNADNEHAGLYTTDRTDTENFQGDFDKTIAAANAKADEDGDDISDHMDDMLLEIGFERIWAEEVTTDNPEV
jgi:hypothetical protein